MGKGARARQSRSNVGALPNYWHGGVAGLSVGEDIRPSSQVVLDWANSGTHYDYDPTFAYITTDFDLAHDTALRRAQTLGLATVYRVQPEGPTSHDDDYPVGVALRCRRARIVEVTSEITASAPSRKSDRKYAAWTDGRSLYDAEGYVQPSEILLAQGVSQADLRPLGPDASFEDIESFATELILARRGASSTFGQWHTEEASARFR